MKLLDLLEKCVNVNVDIYNEQRKIASGNASILACTKSELLEPYIVKWIYNVKNDGDTRYHLMIEVE